VNAAARITLTRLAKTRLSEAIALLLQGNREILRDFTEEKGGSSLSADAPDRKPRSGSRAPKRRPIRVLEMALTRRRRISCPRGQKLIWAITVKRTGKVNFVFRLSLKFYGLG
jgi:hypothetical protein